MEILVQGGGKLKVQGRDCYPVNDCIFKSKELIPFEKDVFAMIKNIKFRQVRNDFQNKLSEDIKTINTDVLVSADKSSTISII